MTARGVAGQRQSLISNRTVRTGKGSGDFRRRVRHASVLPLDVCDYFRDLPCKLLALDSEHELGRTHLERHDGDGTNGDIFAGGKQCVYDHY